MHFRDDDVQVITERRFYKWVTNKEETGHPGIRNRLVAYYISVTKQFAYKDFLLFSEFKSYTMDIRCTNQIIITNFCNRRKKR